MTGQEEQDQIQQALTAVEVEEPYVDVPGVQALIFDVPIAKADGIDEGGSQQLPKEDGFSEISSEILAPPISFNRYALGPRMSTRLKRSIHIYSRNTVGLGWTIESKVEVDDDTPEEEREKVQAETQKLKDFFDAPNPEMPFPTLMYVIKVDEETLGNAFVEVIRNQKGEITELWHMPAHTVRLLKEDRGYVQIRGVKKRYFKRFGDEKPMDPDTGRSPEGPLAPDKRANEVIHFKLYSTGAEDYGLPRWDAAWHAISGNWLSAKRNVNFFVNDATPRIIITVSGGKLDQESVDSIKSFLRFQHKGTENAHRVCVLQPDRKKVGLQSNDPKTEITVTPLTVGVTEDASFLAYRKANNDEIREAFGIAETFFTSSDVTKASALTSRQITNEQEFEPDRLEKEHIINNKIVPTFKVSKVKFRFKRSGLVDPKDQAEIDQIYSRAGAMTINDLRRNAGLAPFPSKFRWANLPMQIIALSYQSQDGPKLPGAMAGHEDLPDTDVEDLVEEAEKITSGLKSLFAGNGSIEVKREELVHLGGEHGDE